MNISIRQLETLKPDEAEGSLRRRLLEIPGIRDAAILKRHRTDTEEETLAFLVTEILPDLKRLLPDTALTPVAVTCLPRLANGTLDRGALLSLVPVRPVISETAAEIDGGPLPPETEGRCCLADALERTAHAGGETAMLFVGADRETVAVPYTELRTRALAIAGGFAAAGIAPGTPVMTQCAEPAACLSAIWGAIYAGLVPVPLGVPQRLDAADAAAQRLADAADLLPDAIFVAPSACQAELTRYLSGRNVLALETLADTAPVTAPYQAKGDDPGFLFLTSGSTSRPKVVVQTHTTLLAQCRAANAASGFGPRDVSLNWLPLDHVGGMLMMHLRDLYNGSTQVHAPSEAFLRDPLIWLDWLEQFGATNSWAPSFAYGLVVSALADAKDRRWSLDHVRILFNGGEAVVRSTAEAFVDALAPHGLPGSAMRPIWGMSETASGSIVSTRFLDERSSGRGGPVGLGRPMPGNRVRIAGPDGRVLREGETGVLQFTGAMMLKEYRDNPKANVGAFTADGWFDTGDLGMISDGALYLMGREKDVLIAAGRNIDPADAEATIEAVPGVRRSFSAVTAIARPGEQDRIVVFYVPDDSVAPDRVAAAIRGALARRFGLLTDALVRLEMCEVPKTPIGKIQKDKLRAGYLAGRFALVDGVTSGQADPIHAEHWAPAMALREPARQGASLALIGPQAAQLAEIISHREGMPVQALPVDAVDGSRICLLEHNDIMLLPGALSGADRALDVLRSLGAVSRHSPLRLTVLEQGIQRLAQGDRPDPDRAMIVGLMRSAAAEYPALNCRAVDPGETAAADALSRIVAAEFSDPAHAPEVAWRDGIRYLRRFVPATAGAGGVVLRQGGHYLLTGGLGGIGLHLARYLQTQQNAELTLIGRREEMSLSRDCTAALAGLRGSGEVRYLAADVADATALRAVTGDLSVDGIFHLAGTAHLKPLAELTHADRIPDLAAKVAGSRAVIALARDLGIPFVVNFASLNGTFGGAGTGWYAAANRFQQALAGAADPKLTVRTIAWSMWDETGVSKDYGLKEVSARQGYRILDPRHALDLLPAALAASAPVVNVGIDTTRGGLRAELDCPFGIAAPATRIDECSKAPATPRQPPATDMVSGIEALCGTIARTWQDVLGLPAAPGPEENVFDLGATSLAMPRIAGLLSERMKVEIDLLDLFEFPVQNALARHLSR